MIEHQKDVTLVTKKDYIKHPKPNGYKSLHLIVSVPVFMSDRVEQVYVEIQIRTVAMGFWASLGHKIYYKYDNAIPEHLSKELADAAKVANDLDQRMEQLHKEVNEVKEQDQPDNEEKPHFPINFLESFIK